VALGGGFAGVGVVGDFVGVEVEGAVTDLDVAAEFVDGTFLFLLCGLNANIDSTLNLGEDGRTGRAGGLRDGIRGARDPC
jgi:hypothetical protein